MYSASAHLIFAGAEAQIARTSPGTDFFPAPPLSLLCQRGMQWDLLPPAEGGRAASSGSPRRVTVREVLKYSLTWVILPSVTVQAWIHWTGIVLPLDQPWPSTSTVEPKAAMETGSKKKDSSGDVPVSSRIICWHDGGPWKHHPMSGSSRRCTASTFRSFRASYRAWTTLSLCSSSRTEESPVFASSGRASLVLREDEGRRR